MQKRIKREANFGLRFRHWALAHKHLFSKTTNFELKQTLTDSISFASVKEHQISWLNATKEYAMYKPPDDSIGYKPFDYTLYIKCNAFVVIRYPDFFVLIESAVFEKESVKSKRRSLTSERAKEIAWIIVDL
jgi:penicillin-binding protein-related factor A (putative recombinase)